ncbi:hypothetical protein CRENBAI_008954, partial [Crenichthys baileyi]
NSVGLLFTGDSPSEWRREGGERITEGFCCDWERRAMHNKIVDKTVCEKIASISDVIYENSPSRFLF